MVSARGVSWYQHLRGRISGSRRRAWVGSSRVHVEVRADPAALERAGAELERVLQRLPGVSWARLVPVLRRVVVEAEPAAVGAAELAAPVGEQVAEFERQRGLDQGRPATSDADHPGDDEALWRIAVELWAALLGIGVASGLRFVRAGTAAFHIDVAAVLAIIEDLPALRRQLERQLPAELVELVLALAGSVNSALLQGRLGLAATAVQRYLQRRELRARRQVFAAREGELCGAPERFCGDVPAPGERPVPLPPGPVEKYSAAAGMAAMGGFGLGFTATQSFEKAAAAVFAGLPRPAGLGRESFACQLGAMLAQRGVLVRAPAALRLLDRIDCVVVDAGILAAPGAGALAAALTASGLAVTVAAVAPAIDPVAAVGGVGESPPGGGADVAAAPPGAWREWVPACVLEAGPAGAVIRERQREGRVVLFIGGAPGCGFAAADCSVALVASTAPVPWSAHILAPEDGALAALLVRAAGAARRASTEGVRIAAAEVAVALLLSTRGLKAGTTRRVMRVASAAAVLAMASGLRHAGALAGASTPAAGVQEDSHRARLDQLRQRAGQAIARLRDELFGAGEDRRCARPGVPGAAPAPAVPGGDHAPACAPPAWHEHAPEEVLRALYTSRAGLSTDEARRRQPPPRTHISPVQVLAGLCREELANPLTAVLGLGAALSAATGAVIDALLIGGVLVGNGLIGGLQRYQALRAIEDLERSRRYTVSAWRDRQSVRIPAEEVAVGDVLYLQAGDVIPADCRVLEAHGVEVDESSLTGESLPVVKQVAPTPGVAVADRACMLYAGSAVAAGSVIAVAVAVGQDTEAARVLTAVEQGPPATGVEQRLQFLTELTAPFAALSGLAISTAGLARGQALREVMSNGVSLAVAAVPEGLPVLATVAQLAAARRLARRGVLVRNPRAIETLGRVDVLCADKTGTLTEGRIALRLLSDGECAQGLEGPLDRSHRAILAAALRASPPSTDAAGGAPPDALDRALLEAGARSSITGADRPGDWERLGELPFESGRGFHAVMARSGGAIRLSVKGAPEMVLPRCARRRCATGERPLDEAGRRALLDEVHGFARRGLRVIAIAERSFAGSARRLDEADLRDMVFCGLAAFSDPVRPTARQAMNELRQAGVATVMITGDHPSTAEAIAAELGILNGDRVMAGAELDAMDDEALDRAVTGVAVFARVTPAQKVRIVQALKRTGRTVAMTGDGSNDAAAIRLADVGVAVGASATPAARQAADLIVTDGQIETIGHAALEGRALWISVRDAVAILVGGNLGEILFTLGGGLLGAQAPLTARQLLLINLLTDVLPAMAIALRPPENKTAAQLASEGPDSSLGAALHRDIAWRAGITATSAGVAFALGRATGTLRRAQTIALLTLTATQLGQTLVTGGRSRAVVWTGLGSFAALCTAVQVPGLSQFFGCTPLGPLGLLQAGTVAALATGASLAAPTLDRLMERLPGLSDIRVAEVASGLTITYAPAARPAASAAPGASPAVADQPDREEEYGAEAMRSAS